MAIYKVINEPGDYQNPEDVENVIRYITSPTKVGSDGIFGGAVLLEIAADAMNCVTDLYHKKSGPRVRHSVLSFSTEEPITLDQVKEVAQKCIGYYENDYQIVAGVHEDKEHRHIHFAMSTTSYRTGRKYCGDKADCYGFLKHMNQATAPYGIRVKRVKNAK